MGYSYEKLYDYFYWNEMKKKIKMLWDSIYDENIDTNQEIGFIDIFDDFHDSLITKYPKKYVKELSDVGVMYRARKWDVSENYNLMITPDEHACENRWNPPGKAFMYLSVGNCEELFDDTINIAQKTCFEEIRLKNGDEAVVCEFKPRKNAKLINLYFENEDISNIIKNLMEIPVQIRSNLIDVFLNDEDFMSHLQAINNSWSDKEVLFKDNQDKLINKLKSNNIDKLITRRVSKNMGDLFLTLLDETIFKPVEEKYDPELKDYKPFHYFSKYLMAKGYNGVIYRSTRMNKIGLICII